MRDTFGNHANRDTIATDALDQGRNVCKGFQARLRQVLPRNCARQSLGDAYSAGDGARNHGLLMRFG